LNELLVLWLGGVGIITKGCRGNVKLPATIVTFPVFLKVAVSGGNVDSPIKPICFAA